MTSQTFKLPIEVDAFHVSTYELIQTESGSSQNQLGKISGLLARKMPKGMTDYPVKSSMCTTYHKYRRIPNQYYKTRDLLVIDSLYKQKSIKTPTPPPPPREKCNQSDKGIQTSNLDIEQYGMSRRACSRVWQGLKIKNNEFSASLDFQFERKRKGWEL
ncbi:hypothetical protein SS50377_22035 [Spironucleus salmonicida]|uniref:Uncharacterized protein n=1 Tax=Spironucleus salmonicida TaxID=348837 RepID=V6LME1_9EUKA|nr:hypothetical protein SS50377_22035 [Spironucleus salmonicida]|eukprot:EST45800.1 Hypothetical protein SS50377_14374 [Spironucleus salmonicida]